MAYKQFKKDGTPAKKPGKKPDPNKIPRRPSTYTKGVKRPHVWLIGPDEYKHKMYQPWLCAKAQANFREEEWNLPFEDYFAAWDGLWEQRGRDSDNLCMTRIEYDGAWEKSNIEIITRKEHCSKQKEYKSRHGYSALGYKKPGRKAKTTVYVKVKK
jgi:hypothetical protein